MRGCSGHSITLHFSFPLFLVIAAHSQLSSTLPDSFSYFKVLLFAVSHVKKKCLDWVIHHSKHEELI